MSRSAPLLALLQALRQRRRAATAEELAGELGIPVSTVLRDIATLVAEGAPINGAAGSGYLLRPGFSLPPLMLEEDELDAILLGLKLVARREDANLSEVAESAMGKIIAVLPAEPEAAAHDDELPVPADQPNDIHLMAILRQAIRQEQRLRLRYTDKKGKGTDRIVWPIVIDFVGAFEAMAAWCETREDFRHFRLDRIAAAELLESGYPRRRRVLLAEWRAENDMDDGY